MSPANFIFDEKVHPWIQVAELFKLRSGAMTGHPDQSLLVNSVEHLNVLTYICWLTHGFNRELKIYTLEGALLLDLKGSDLISVNKIESIYKKIHKKTDYVIDMSGAFDNNFSLHVFLYDVEDELCIVRSKLAYVKKSTKVAFNKIYPATINNFGQYEFGTPWPVDIVYTWVNKDDPGWIELWNQSFPDTPFDPDRFSSRDELKYSLRSICRFLPWFQTIYIVSNCRKPDWLIEHPKIKWIDHAEVFPDKSVLPTFNSHAIEASLHKIDSLNERFIYLNDDMFINQPTYYSDFYDNLGRTIAHLEPYGMVYENNCFDVTKDYLSPAMNCQRLVKNTVPSYTATRLHNHSPYALRKSVMIDIEERFQQEFDKTRAARLRTPEDINVTSFLFHHFGLATGKTVSDVFPYLIVRPTNINSIVNGNAIKYKYLCFNDGDGSSENARYTESYFKIINQMYPSPSYFEVSCKSWNSLKISKTIMAYHKREHRIPGIRRLIGDAKVSLDDGSWGLFENSKRTWLSYEKTASFHMLIQDDAIVCENFYDKLSLALSKKGEEKTNFVYSLYFRLKRESKPVFIDFNKKAKVGLKKGGFDDTSLRYGLAYIAPTRIINDMITFAETLSELGAADDTRYSRYFQANKMEVNYILPSLVDQAADEVSTQNGSLNVNRGATWFIGNNNFADEFV